ncbi:MAG: DNA polymerase III subunit delta' [Elusimicrobia bacterium]|jgi:DNA polymerase-3 subunit delta'|nr:MAG: DNA polymerase III subunit delta' [Elusimicrobiota bacterium]
MTPVVADVFRHVQGQDAALGLLAAALEAGRVPHAYIFSGPAGVGKKTAARALAAALLCAAPRGPAAPCGECPACRKVDAGAHPDLLWVDYVYQAALLKEEPEKQRSLKIDTVRRAEASLRLKPLEGRVKMAVITPADALVEAAAHALLKLVEEPPPGTHLVLITEEVGALLPTLRSRCQRVRFSPLSVDALTRILTGDRLDAAGDDLARAVRGAEGSVLKARALLDAAEGLRFDWEGASLSELLAWGEGFQNPRLGRPAAERFLEGVLAQCQADVRAGTRDAEDLRRVFESLTRLRRNAAVSLTVQHLLLHLRRAAKKRGEAS